MRVVLWRLRGRGDAGSRRVGLGFLRFSGCGRGLGAVGGGLRRPGDAQAKKIRSPGDPVLLLRTSLICQGISDLSCLLTLLKL